MWTALTVIIAALAFALGWLIAPRPWSPDYTLSVFFNPKNEDRLAEPATVPQPERKPTTCLEQAAPQPGKPLK